MMSSTPSTPRASSDDLESLVRISRPPRVSAFGRIWRTGTDACRDVGVGGLLASASLLILFGVGIYFCTKASDKDFSRTDYVIPGVAMIVAGALPFCAIIVIVAKGLFCYHDRYETIE